MSEKAVAWEMKEQRNNKDPLRKDVTHKV